MPVNLASVLVGSGRIRPVDRCARGLGERVCSWIGECIRSVDWCACRPGERTCQHAGIIVELEATITDSADAPVHLAGVLVGSASGLT